MRRAASITIPAIAAIACAMAWGCRPSGVRQRRPAEGLVERLEGLGVFELTYYWVAEEADHIGPRTETVPGLPGKYSKGFKKALTTEGTGRLLDGRIVNAAGGGKYAFTDAKWGLGCRDQPLVPFRSIATDPKVIPTGSVVMIEQFVGMKLPGGGYHDGTFWADDVGGSIKGKHIDVFIARRQHLKHMRQKLPRRYRGAMQTIDAPLDRGKVNLFDSRKAPAAGSTERGPEAPFANEFRIRDWAILH